MGMMKQMWAGTWMPYVPNPEPLFGVSILDRLHPLTETGCRHEWKSVPGIYKVYVNCKHCGIGKETLNAENS